MPNSMFCIRFWLRRLSITTIRASSSPAASQMEAPTSISTVSAATETIVSVYCLPYEQQQCWNTLALSLPSARPIPTTSTANRNHLMHCTIALILYIPCQIVRAQADAVLYREWLIVALCLKAYAHCTSHAPTTRMCGT